MPSWKHKTEEEKKALLVKLAEHNKPKEVRQQEEDAAQYRSILDAKEIPFRCASCHLWTGSDYYEIDDQPSPLSILTHKSPPDLVPYILGTCRHCRQPVKRVMLTTLDDYMVTASLIMLLHSQRRLRDRRKIRG